MLLKAQFLPYLTSYNSIVESDALPAIYFNNKTYVREDFRDMLAANVPLTASNELWNRDVELLVQNWRQSNTQDLKKNIDSEKEISAEKFDDLLGGSERWVNVLQQMCD